MYDNGTYFLFINVFSLYNIQLVQMVQLENRNNKPIYSDTYLPLSMNYNSSIDKP
jgi:hypothetical protein